MFFWTILTEICVGKAEFSTSKFYILKSSTFCVHVVAKLVKEGSKMLKLLIFSPKFYSNLVLVFYFDT